MRNKLFLLISASLVSTSLYAMDSNFDDVDANQDGQVTQSELYTALSDSGIHSNSDKDKDGSLNEDEFSETDFDEELFKDWDINSDNRLDENEFSNGLFSKFDKNEDGHWDEDEWDTAKEKGLGDLK